MSRENDSSSAGPQGRGANAYPSGTPPYGPRPFPSLHPQERQRPAGAPVPGGTQPPATGQPAEPSADEPKTETTLTTRVRINIPGSRPIPPVVVRTPVDENGAGAPAAEASEEAPAGPGSAAAEAAPEPEKTSDWFAPRKPVAAPPAEAEGPDTTGPDGPGQGGPRQGAPGPGAGTTGPGAPYGAGPEPDAFDGPGPGTGSDPSRDPFRDPAGPGAFGGYASGDDTGANAFPPAGPGTVGGGFPPAADRSPRGSRENPAAGFDAPFAPGTEDFPPGVPRPSAPYPADADGYGGQGGQGGQGNGRFDDGGQSFAPPNAAGPAGGSSAPTRDDPFSSFPGFQPAGPTTGPATGSMPVPPVGPSGFRPPVPSSSGPPPGERFSGDTLVGGIPTVPSSPNRPGPPGPRVQGPRPVPVPSPNPAPAPAATPSPSAGPKKKKGRSKVVLLGVAVGGVVVLAYGAGLLMNHADVPKGTTVLGVDIGNESRDEAGKSLEQALGTRTTAPLTLTIGEKKLTLKPSVAGLSFDTDATVRGAAHADYNPVSVIGSLFGGTRTATPVIMVDEDKLKAALQDLAGRSSTATESMIRFEPNKVVPVPGKAGSSFDVNAAATRVAAAYRTRAETGTDTPVAVAVTTVEPKVAQAELEQAAKGFAKHAMSHVTTVKADGNHFINIGPNVSLPKILTMVPDDSGHLQPHIDLKALESLYGSAFDGVKLKRSDGGTTAVTPQDVATALLPALDKTSDQTVTLPGVAG